MIIIPPVRQQVSVRISIVDYTSDIDLIFCFRHNFTFQNLQSFLVYRLHEPYGLSQSQSGTSLPNAPKTLRQGNL